LISEVLLSDADTKKRILDAAERLFADQGFDATSLRSITAQASVNLAAVNYHFGSKEGLIRAVLSRRIEPLNSERLRLLDALEQGSPSRAEDVEEILRCFFGPALAMWANRRSGAARFMQMFGRTFTEPGPRLKELIAQQFAEVARRFGDALGRALPDLPREELAWRMHFMVGAMAHTVSNQRSVAMFCGGAVPGADGEELLGRLVRFAAAGLRAPAHARAAGGSR
jgi:AcrR family transcriptional regulator